MNRRPIITCAVTGAGDTVSRNPHVPVTPKQIADAAIDAARAGAAVAHIHVRDPETGQGNRDPKLFKEVVDRILHDEALRPHIIERLSPTAVLMSRDLPREQLSELLQALGVFLEEDEDG